MNTVTYWLNTRKGVWVECMMEYYHHFIMKDFLHHTHFGGLTLQETINKDVREFRTLNDAIHNGFEWAVYDDTILPFGTHSVSMIREIYDMVEDGDTDADIDEYIQVCDPDLKIDIPCG